MESTETNSLLDDKVKRFIAADRAILLSMEDAEIEAIVYAIELELRKKIDENEQYNHKSDDLIERIEETLDKVKVRDEFCRVDRKHCIYYLKNNVIKPLEELKKDIMNDKKSLNKLEERIDFYRSIVRKLMEKPVIV
jgi:hypothetical protein